MKAPSAPMPRSLRNVRRDRRGFPIPFIIAWDGPHPMFAVVDPLKWRQCAHAGRCALCGSLLPDYKVTGANERRATAWYIGGDLCARNRVFYDPGMCEGCARYAVLVCPYLAMPNYSRHTHKPNPEKGIGELKAASNKRPD